MIIAVDLDGVVADMEAGLNLRLPNVGITPKALTDYSFVADYTSDEVKYIKSILKTPGFFRSLPLIEGARNALTMLAMSADVRFVTSWMCGAPLSAGEKVAWVQEKFGEAWARRVILTQDKTLVRADILIDDKPEITGLMTPVWKRWIFDHPYNRHIKGVRMTWKNWGGTLEREREA